MFYKILIMLLMIVTALCENKYDGYFGGWPVNQDKNKIENPGYEFMCLETLDKQEVGCKCFKDSDCKSGSCFSSPRVGKYCLQGEGTVFPRYNLIDQYGEMVDIYDFSGHGKFIVIEFSTAWCRPCRELASWLTNGDDTVSRNRWWKEDYSIIKDLINDDRIYFINIQIQDEYKEPSSLFSIEDWFQEYPDEKIPILGDSNYHVRDWMRITGYPSVIVLNDKMEIAQFSIRGWHDAFNFISNINWDTNK